MRHVAAHKKFWSVGSCTFKSGEIVKCDFRRCFLLAKEIRGASALVQVLDVLLGTSLTCELRFIFMDRQASTEANHLGERNHEKLEH